MKRDNGDVFRRALDFAVAERRKCGRPNMTWKRQVEEHTDQIGLKKDDAIDRVKWRNGVYKLSKHEVNPVTYVNADKTVFKKLNLNISLKNPHLIHVRFSY